MADRLYVWTNPLQALSHWDHTWVTTYDAPFSCQDGPPQHYWYCWGSCHAAGPGTTARLLGSAPASVPVATCICAPDDPIAGPYRSSVGGINFYGVQGVCHQVANRILYATTTNPPLTVQGARGFDYTRTIYGTYGTNARDWKKRIKRCTGRDIDQESVSQEFRTHVAHRLQKRTSAAATVEVRRIHDRLLSQHEALCAEVLAGRLDGRAFAVATNNAFSDAGRAWAAALSTEEYILLFGVAPAERCNVLDPDTAARTDYTTKDPSATSRKIPLAAVTAKKAVRKRRRRSPFAFAAKKAAKRVAITRKAAPKKHAATGHGKRSKAAKRPRKRR